jgi:hypothetical protein
VRDLQKSITGYHGRASTHGTSASRAVPDGRFVRTCRQNGLSGDKPRPSGGQPATYSQAKKAAPCGYDYEPTFIRWVSSSSIPASPATEDPLPGRDVGLPSNACRFTQFVPQGDDKSNVGELAPRCQS